MVDRRANDLSHGHLGESTYDLDTNEWRFSLEIPAPCIRLLLSLRTVIAPSIFVVSPPANSSKDRTTSTKLLVKSRPETQPATRLLLSYLTTQSSAQSGPHFGQLLAVGQAADIEQTFGSRKTTIIATSCEEGGHVLRLIKPGVARHEWGSKSSVRLSTLDAASFNEGYWVGIGGRILQIAFAEKGDLQTNHLAVRQVGATTIFRPVYRSDLVPAVAPRGYVHTYPASRLHANPIATLTAERSGLESHADVTFNPWYSRQFAVVDDFGSWSTWEFEGGYKKDSCARLIQGKRANIYDGFAPDSGLKKPNNADGWHKVLWAGNLSTIVVCNRRHLAVFDVKSAPTRIQTKNFFAARNSDWILDLKRSPSNLGHLFVLTSSRIFWLEIIPDGEGKNGDIGFRIFLSYRHFRDPNDETLRLAILKGDEDHVAVFSERTPLVHIYKFSTTSDGLYPKSSQTSLNLSSNFDGQNTRTSSQLQSLCFLDAPLKPTAYRSSGPEHQYLDENIKFYQLLALSSDLGLRSGVCTLLPLGTSKRQLVPPTKTCSYSSGYSTTKRVASEPWIVPDGLGDENGTLVNRLSSLRNVQISVREGKDDHRPTMNFRSVFEHAFGPDNAMHVAGGMTEFFEGLQDQIKQVKGASDLALTTLLELSHRPSFSEDLEQAAPILLELLKSVEEEEEPPFSSAMVLSDLMLCPGIEFERSEDSSLPELLKVYDQVAENWIATLPFAVPVMTRLAKFKIARKLAVELCLSSIGASLHDRESKAPSLPVQDEGGPEIFHPSAAISRAGSPATFSSQTTSSSFPRYGLGLPTPSQTPSLYSRSQASASQPTEDPVISRLRKYAVSIERGPDLRASRILSHWPAAPGVNPETYSYKAMQEAEASGEESDHRKRRLSRRKRRTEMSISIEETPGAAALSQPTAAPFVSQPDISNQGNSSPRVNDIPLTQPDRGAFGSRFSQGKTKFKRKKAAGFR